MTTTKPYKAVAAFLVTFVSSLLLLVQDKTEFSDLTPLQWLIAVASALATSATVYGVSNPPTRP